MRTLHCCARATLPVPQGGWGVSGRGSRVLVTGRAAGGGAPGRLREQGVDAVHVPLIEIEPAGDEPIDLAGYDWVVVTSPNGAASSAPRRRLAPAVGGDRTGDGRGPRRRRRRPSGVDAGGTSRGAAAAGPGRVLFAGAAGARDVLADELDADVLVLYRTSASSRTSGLHGDLVVLASASAATALGPARRGIPAVSIGPETTRAARSAGVDVVAEAVAHDLDGLVAAVEPASGGDRALRAGVNLRPCRRSSRSSDFGLQDDFVGTCHGDHRADRARRGDDRHHARHPAASGAAEVRSCSRTRYRTCPSACILQSSTRASAVRGARSRCVTPKGASTSAPTTACSCPRRSAWASRTRESSPTWHMRSSRSHARSTGATLAPVAAAHLANGVPLAELGPPGRARVARSSDLPEPAIGETGIDATTLYVDSFGNIALNLTRDDVERIGIAPGTRVELDLGGQQYYAVAARTFADARHGDVILYEDSYRNMSVAISNGSAGAMLHAAPGSADPHPALGVERADALGSRPQERRSRRGQTGPDASPLCRSPARADLQRRFFPWPPV